MYKQFFGLRERPFDLTPNPRYLYLTPRHQEALSNLQYGIAGRRGITLLVGEAGTGKTTLVRAAIDMIAGPALRCVYLSNPVLTRADFYEFIAPKLGLSARAAASKAQFLMELEDVLLATQRAGGTTALIVDEAQSLPHELMEEVRLLANFETPEEKLLQVVLAGQPELADRLEHEELRQLKQRVALRCDLRPLDVRETASYISGRIAIAGGRAVDILTREAVLAIHERSRGIPRLISVICDNALVTAFATGVKPIDAALVIDVCRDFRLGAMPKTEKAIASATVVAQTAEPQPGNGHARLPAVARAFSPPLVGAPPPRVAVEPPAPAPERTLEPSPEMASDRDERMFSWFAKKKGLFGLF